MAAPPHVGPRRLHLGARHGVDALERIVIGLEPPAGLLVHDLYLTGSLHELVHDSALGRSNYLQFSYRISDGSGRIVASDTIDYRRSQNRAPIYR
jgi:hypothetical protein